jgi:hypothetical protein
LVGRRGGCVGALKPVGRSGGCTLHWCIMRTWWNCLLCLHGWCVFGFSVRG